MSETVEASHNKCSVTVDSMDRTDGSSGDRVRSFNASHVNKLRAIVLASCVPSYEHHDICFRLAEVHVLDSDADVDMGDFALFRAAFTEHR